MDNSGVVKAASAELRAHGDVYKLAVNNSGIIEARGVARTPEGRVFLTARGKGGAAGAVVNSGGVRALDSDGSGGEAYITGEQVTLAAGSLVDVSAESGAGGTALIGGEFQGGANWDAKSASRERLDNASSLTVAAGAEVRADGAGAGDGGLAVLWADGHTEYAGHVSARGGAAGGDGGFVEVSGKKTLHYAGSADTRGGAGGETGTLLLDPADVVVGGVGSTVSAATITDNLKTNNVVVQTTTTGVGNGNIKVNDAIIWTSGKSSDNSLTLLAWNNILLNNHVRNFTEGGSETAKGNLTLVAGWNGAGTISGGVFIYPSTLPSSAKDMTADADGTYTWFGNTDDRPDPGVGYQGSIILNASDRAVNVGSRNGATTLLGNNVALIAGSANESYAQIGYKAKNDAKMTAQIASGAIRVAAKGAVTLTATGTANAANAYAQIGHGGGLYSENAAQGYNLTAKNAALTVLSGGGVTLTAGTGVRAFNSYAGIGHGGGVFSYEGAAASTVTASGSALTVDVSGNVTLAAGTGQDAYNSYAGIGHGGSVFSYAQSTATWGGAQTGMDMSVVADSITLNGGGLNSHQAFIGMGMHKLDGSAFAWSTPTGANGRLVIRAVNGGVTFGSADEEHPEYVANAHIVHGGTGDFSLITESDMTLGAVAGEYDFRNLETLSPDANTGNFLLHHTGALNLVSEGDITVRQTLVRGNAIAAATGNNAAWKRSALNLVAGWDDSSTTSGWTASKRGTANPLVGIPAAFAITSAMIPGSAAEFASKNWFGVGEKSITIAAVAGGVALASRHGATALYGHNVTLTAGSDDERYAQIGYKAANDDSMTAQIASGAIRVAAKGAVTLTATGTANAANAYAQIGHGGGLYSGNAAQGYKLEAKNAALTVLSGGGVTLTGGTGDDALNSYAGIGHGGGVLSVSEEGTATSTVDASGSALTLDVSGGGVTLTGGTWDYAYNSYAGIGHGGGVFSFDSTATSTVTASGSALTLDVSGGGVTLAGGTGVRAYNSYAGIGHGGGVVSFDSTATSTVDASGSALTVDVSGDVTLTGGTGEYASNSYAGIGHGGGVYSDAQSTATWGGDLPRTGMNMSVVADSIALNGGAAIDQQAFIGMGMYKSDGSAFTWSTPTGANGRLVIRAVNGGVTFGETVANAHIVHGGTGHFALLGKSAMTLAGDRLLLSKHAGVASIGSQGALALTGTLKAGGSLHLLSGWNGASGWTAAAFNKTTTPWTVAPAAFEPAKAVVEENTENSLSAEHLAVAGDLAARSGYDLTLKGEAKLGRAGYLRALNDLVLDESGSLSTSYRPAAGLAALLAVAGGKFLNNSSLGGKALSAAEGSWLVWTGNAKESEANGLAGSAASRQFNFAAAPAPAYAKNGALSLSRAGVNFTGNGFLLPGAAPKITVTANGSSMFYGDTPNKNWGYTADTDSFTGMILGDTLDDVKKSLAFGRIVRSTDATNKSNAGGTHFTAVSGATSNLGYGFAYKKGVMEIKRRPVAVVAGAQREYGDANPAAPYAVGGKGLANGDRLAGSAIVAADSASDANAVYAITQGGVTNANNPNYNIAWTDGVLRIVPRKVVVAADETARVIGLPNPVFTWSFASGGMADNDALSVKLSSLADIASPVGRYDIVMDSFTITGTKASNYDLTYDGAGKLIVAAPPSAGNDIRVQLPASESGSAGSGTAGSAGPGAVMTPPPADAEAFGEMVNMEGLSSIRPPAAGTSSAVPPPATGDADFGQSFIVTRDLWKRYFPVESGDAIADSGPASQWRTRPLERESASRSAAGITLDEARSRLLPALNPTAPEGWEYRVEYAETGETDENGEPIMGIRVVLARKA